MTAPACAGIAPEGGRSSEADTLKDTPAAIAGQAVAEPVTVRQPGVMITNVLQLHRLAAAQRRLFCSLRLEGVVCAVDAARARFVFQDDSGAELIGLDRFPQPLQPGQRVRLQARSGLVELAPAGLRLRKAPLIDNDGIHAVRLMTRDVFLQAGLHPLRVAWFNRLGRYGLEVTYQGPGLVRQRIPSSALFRTQADAATGHTNQVNGLDYCCYEGDWESMVPDFGQLTPVRTGVATNFDLDVRTRDERVGLEFRGYLAVARSGVYTLGLASDDGSQLFVGESEVSLETLGSAPAPVPRRLAPGQELRADEEAQWAEVEGTVTFASEQNGRLELQLGSGAERMRVVVLEAAGLTARRLLRTHIRAVGFCQGVYGREERQVAGELCVLSGDEVSLLETVAELRETPPAGSTLPVLTRVEEIKSLKREEAQRAYPVRIQGVVTRADSLVVQDATRGIFVSRPIGLTDGAPRLGEYWEVEGVTGPGDFAPVVQARRLRRLGAGQLPEPVRASWDQLMNGSLDTQYVELQGLVTAVEGNRLELRLREGKIKVTFPELTPATLEGYQQTLVRVRGCLFPAWARATHRLKVGEMEMASATLTVDEPAPKDLFSIPRKQAAELLLFDYRANAFQRVKVAGQLLAARAGQYFMMDGANGVRFLAGAAQELQPGDLVEAVGFPDLVGPSPVLREAVARRTGHAELPAPRTLQPEALLNEANDATRVRVEGVLVNRRTEQDEQVLEVQIGVRTIVARLGTPDASVRALALGTVLELTGVYVGQGGNRALGRGLDSFALLLGSAADIRVLARPPWWTLRRLLTFLGIMAIVLLGAMLWAFALKRQVNAQTEVIRQNIESEAIAQERNRIARELHDTLEQALAGIGLQLNALWGSLPKWPADALRILDITRSMVRHGQEEARRTVRNLRMVALEQSDLPDALAQLAAQAGQGLPTSIQTSITGAPQQLSNRVESHLLRIGQEAVTNAVKHARARAIHLELEYQERWVRLHIQDDGCGFDAAQAAGSEAGHFGLLGMRERAEKLGGTLRIQSAPGQGTSIEVSFPLAARAVGPQEKV